MELADEARQVRAAQNQSLFREVNERIEGLNEGFGMILLMGEWVCECADETCVERMELTVEDYEAIRQHPNRFPVLPGHEQLDVEWVVEHHERYVIVSKLDKAGEVAREHDPRAARR
jgi:hypothetical protein